MLGRVSAKRGFLLPRRLFWRVQIDHEPFIVTLTDVLFESCQHTKKEFHAYVSTFSVLSMDIDIELSSLAQRAQ